VSANALRGILRRYLMRELLAVCGLDRTTPSWDRLYAAVAGGGTLEKQDKRIEPERIRRVREALPAVSVLGAFFYRWMLPGHLRPKGFLWPVCSETVTGGLVHSSTPLEELLHADELVTETSFVRHVEPEHADVEVTGVKPMPITFEVLAVGTVLQVELDFARHTPALERAAVAHGLSLLSYLGARSAAGLGSVELTASGADSDPATYRQWLVDQGCIARAREMLLWLPSTWMGKVKEEPAAEAAPDETGGLYDADA
jgi:hypothetical protein